MLSEQGKIDVQNVSGSTEPSRAATALLIQAVLAVICLTIGVLRYFAAVPKIGTQNSAQRAPSEYLPLSEQK